MITEEEERLNVLLTQSEYENGVLEEKVLKLESDYLALQDELNRVLD